MTWWMNAEPGGPTRIKICGIRDHETAAAAVEAGAHAIGCVMAPGSPRTVSASMAMELGERLPDRATIVGVFVDADVEGTLLPWQPRWTQLHGREDASIPGMLEGPVIRAIPFDPDAIRHWDGHPRVDRLLVDSDRPGSGIPFDHDAFHALRGTLTTPLILAGGLSPETVGDAIERFAPWGVDVSSAVESSPGIKDTGLIRAFCEAVKDADG